MPLVCSSFSQILQRFSGAEFPGTNRGIHARHYALGFSCRSQFVAMLRRIEALDDEQQRTLVFLSNPKCRHVFIFRLRQPTTSS